MTAVDHRLAPALARPLPRAGERRGVALPVPVLLYLLAVVVPLSLPVGPIVLTTLRLLLILMIIPLSIRLLARHYGPVLATDLLFGAHVLWMVAALAANSPNQVVEQTGSVGAEFLGGYVLARAYIRTPETFEALCRAVVVIVCCTLPFAIVEAVTGRNLLLQILRALPVVGSPSVVNSDMRMNLHRVQATFAHPIHYGLFCSVAVPLVFVALKDVTTGVRRWVTGAMVFACTFLSLSSGALLAAVLQLGLILWVTVFAKVKSRWWLLLGLFGLAYVAVDLLSNRTPMRVFMSYATFSPGSAYWRAAINEYGMDNVWANPIFGIGLKDWVRPTWMHSSSVDNFWLLTTMRYGIPGFLLMAIGYAIGVIRVMRVDVGDDPLLTHLRRAWVFTFLGLSFTLYTVHIWTNVYSFVFFMFGAGMWMIHAVPRGTGTEPAGREPEPVRASPHTRFPPVDRGAPTAPAPRAAPRVVPTVAPRAAPRLARPELQRR